MSRMFPAALLVFGLLSFCCAQRGAVRGSAGGGMRAYSAASASGFRSAPAGFAHFSGPRFAPARIAPARLGPARIVSRPMSFSAFPRYGFTHPRAAAIASAPSRRGVFTFGHINGGPFFNTRGHLEFHHHHFPHSFLYAVPYYYYGAYWEPLYDQYWNPYYSFGPYAYDPNAGMSTYTDLSGEVNDLSSQVQQLRDENDSLQAELDESGSRQPAAPAEPASASTSSGPPTALVFNDGHQIEVQNYAIVGQTLWILSDNHASKVPLTDLDLKQTIKLNEDRGVEFLGPSSSTPKQ